ncbi:MAG: hypothetical protein NXI10_00640 [bacterium]|nr:hypothetical protein [bacterium]
MNLNIYKTLLPLALLALLTSSCASTRSYGKKYPEQLHKEVDFNMSLADFNSLKGTQTSDMKDDSFRWVYLESIEDEKMTDIVYYFDKDGDQPLYEMIFIYKDTVARNEAADKLLGAPNDGEEWRIVQEPYTLTAWKYKNKLVMAALIPNTEWDE